LFWTTLLPQSSAWFHEKLSRFAWHNTMGVPRIKGDKSRPPAETRSSDTILAAKSPGSYVTYRQRKILRANRLFCVFSSFGVLLRDENTAIILPRGEG
jgi:hypothetical protein